MDHTLHRAELAAARRALAAANHNYRRARALGDGAALARAADDIERAEMVVAVAGARRIDCVACRERYAAVGSAYCERCASARPTARAA